MANPSSRSLSKASKSINLATIKHIQNLARSTEGVISLAQGIPSFSTPPHIKEAAYRAMKKISPIPTQLVKDSNDS